MDSLLAPVLLAAALLFALYGGRRADALVRRLERLVRRPVSPRRWLAGLAVAALAVQVVTTLVAGVPVPQVADEASYLLAADTFARGRLANPSHPLWQHFLTYYVQLRPTYASVYMPLQGLVLALGQCLGHPVLGVWLGGVLLCVAGGWMLYGWLPPRWARLASALLCLQLVAGRSWSHGYWGGFVAATAGALLLGAAGRLARRPRSRDGAMLGSGAGLLALSRPFEGLFACAAAAAPLALDFMRKRAVRRVLLRAALPAIGVIGVTLGWLAYYDHRLTGSATTLPATRHDRAYSVVPLFLWQSLHAAAEPLPPVMARFYGEYARRDWERQQKLAGWARATAGKLRVQWSFYFGVVLAAPLLALPWALRRAAPRRALLVVAAALASQTLIVQSRPHYVAPAACCAAYLLVEGWRHLRLWRPHGLPFGARLAAALPCVLLLLVPGRMAALRPEPEDWHLRRAEIGRQLAARPGRHLVLVEYGPAHDPQWDWVTNDADLAGTRVLWARSLERDADCRLLAWESRRRAWRLFVAEEMTPPRLVPIASDACAAMATAAPPAPRSSPAAPPPSTAR